MQPLWQLVDDPRLQEVIRRLEERNAEIERRVKALEKQTKK